MKVSEVFSGTYLKPVDLQSRSHALTIERVRVQEFDDGDKIVIAFRGAGKELVCNKTNANAIAEFLGDDCDQWLGRAVLIYPAKTEFQGKRVDCIRVQEPEPPAQQQQPPAATQHAAPHDDTPF